MKQITLDSRLTAMIKAAVGDDVDPSGFAVFETIALNTQPLPRKSGTIFEAATVSMLTLQQMADSINSGNHLPLISNHDIDETPKGRVFHAKVLTNELGNAELRALFYIDDTEQNLRAKLNAGSLDEVSVSFLASQILCSECQFDYRGEEADYSNLLDRTCDNGHVIGENGVHVRLVGLSVFTELSLVSRGAADNPKIVGKSQSKLAAPVQHLAAKGFEVNRLYLSASKGENNVDIKDLVADLTDSKAQVTVLTAASTDLKSSVDTLTTANTELTTKVSTLETELEAAKAESKETELEEANTQLGEAKEFLSDIFTKLAVAAGETNVEAPESIAELKTGIENRQSKLTASLPIGGVSNDGKALEGDAGSKFSSKNASGFKSQL